MLVCKLAQVLHGLSSALHGGGERLIEGRCGFPLLRVLLAYRASPAVRVEVGEMVENVPRATGVPLPFRV